MKSALLVLGAALLWSAPDSPVFAANPAVALRPIRGEVIIIYYSGTTASVQDCIGLAICPAGADYGFCSR